MNTKREIGGPLWLVGEPRTKMVIYVSKYALTTGILRVDAEVNEKAEIAAFKYRGFPIYINAPGYHLTLEDAIARAEEMRAQKIASLHKQAQELHEQAQKLKELRFTEDQVRESKALEY